jgi:hypothetical protein
MYDGGARVRACPVEYPSAGTRRVGQRGSMDALVSVGDAFVVLMVTVLGAGGGCSRRRPWPVMRRLGRELHVVHRLALGLLRGGLRHAQ